MREINSAGKLANSFEVTDRIVGMGGKLAADPIQTDSVGLLATFSHGYSH